MRNKFIALAAAAAAAIALTAAGSSTDRATGGGQVLWDGHVQGAGNTIAFTAQGTLEDARGQVQYVNREAGTGQAQDVRHGAVECLQVDGTVAIIGGTWGDGGTFELYVQDNGEGAADDADLIAVNNSPEDTCTEDNEDDYDEAPALARGNAQVYDAG